ncbi:unnamed protein product [Symbiodinium sp. KB8]|nr:unnamed protein product [Symbiodinium sp. KB8]
MELLGYGVPVDEHRIWSAVSLVEDSSLQKAVLDASFAVVAGSPPSMCGFSAALRAGLLPSGPLFWLESADRPGSLLLCVRHSQIPKSPRVRCELICCAAASYLPRAVAVAEESQDTL